MKKLIIILILAPLGLMGQIKLNWSNEIEVNADRTLGYARPKIALTSNNIPVVMWAKRYNLEVYTAKLNGSSFTSPVKITPAGIKAFAQDWAGPDMVASGSNVFVVFEAEPHGLGPIYLAKSDDGGASFGDTFRVSENTATRFPTIAVAPNGTLYAAFMVFEPGDKDPHYAVSVSTDGGKTFSKDVKATGTAPGESCDCCPAYLIATNTSVTLLFRNNDNNLRDIWASTSTDAGKTFSLSKKVDNSGWIIGGCPSSGPSGIIVGDTLISAWMNGSSGSSRVMISNANTSDLSLGFNQNISKIVATSANQNYPIIAGDSRAMGVVWEEVNLGKRYIKLAYGTTGASSLLNQEAVIVNLDTNSLAKNPHIAYANGTFHITWQDNKSFKIYYRSASIDGFARLKEKSMKDIIIYPNPSNGLFYIDKNEGIKEIWIRDYQGRLIKHMTNSSVIDLRSHKGGLYTATLVTIKGELRIKLIKKED